jgi:hypothetical protein
MAIEFHVGQMPRHVVGSESLRMTNAIIESNGDLQKACQIANVPMAKIRSHAKWLENNFGWKIIQGGEIKYTDSEIQNTNIDLENEIFRPIAKRIRERADSLRGLKRFQTGFEGWLKVEAVAVLGNKVEALRNKGADLLLNGGLQVELKAAYDLNPSWIIGEGVLKYNSPCLFLGDGGNAYKIEALKRDNRIKLVAYEVFSDGDTQWVIGIIVPRINE